MALRNAALTMPPDRVRAMDKRGGKGDGRRMSTYAMIVWADEYKVADIKKWMDACYLVLSPAH